MNKTKITTTAAPRHLNLTKFMFNIIMIGIAIQAAGNIINAVYFMTLPESLIHVTDTGRSYFFQGIGYFNLPYDYLSLRTEITDRRLFAVSFCIVELVVHSLPLIIIMIWGKKLLKTLSQSHSPFTLETTFLIKKIGELMVFMGIFSKLILQISMNIINLHEINFTNPVDLEWIFAGAITLLMADIFARGCYLQQEADETL